MRSWVVRVFDASVSSAGQDETLEVGECNVIVAYARPVLSRIVPIVEIAAYRV